MTFSSAWVRLGFRTILHLILNKGLRKNAWLTWVLFRIKIPGGQRIHWDFTSLALKKCLRVQAQPQYHILEVGTGPYALLAIYLSKIHPGKITACDINPDYVRQAEQVIWLNKASVATLPSDLFDHIPNQFDLIFFNSLYIPRTLGRKLGMDRLHPWETDWCGGNDGTETIARFLRETPGHLKEGGKILLGFNPRYLHEQEVKKLCAHNNLKVISRYSTIFNPSIVLTIGRNSH